MPNMDAPDSTLKIFFPPNFEEDPRLVFASKLKRHSGPGNSVLEYPVGPAKQPDGPPTPVKISLGWGHWLAKDGKKVLHFRVEYTYPLGTADCPNMAIGYYKSTDTAGGITKRHPEPKPHDHPAKKGGFEGSEWEEDKDPAGKNVADRITGSGGGDKGFMDARRVRYLPTDLPLSRDAKFMVEVRDCHDDLVDCLTWELHVSIDKDGKVLTQQATPPGAC
jgi:hypothetical protein